MTTKTPVPAVEGWFTTDPQAPALIGTRCRVCGTVCFPPQTSLCPNPVCEGRELEQVELSRRGTIWSFTNACYQPPPPFIAPTDPFEPFTIAAVELAAEKMVVLGQMVPGVTVEDLRVGAEVEVVLDTLYEDDQHAYLVWKWRPVAAGEA